ncbi:MAG: glycosyltransferase [Treponema sp.]|nr:glycosyltransferase [Treponema sp.]
MKILLVTRGSMGDVFPYLRLAAELKKRGHEVTLSLPRIFDREGKETGVRYVLQAMDDIAGMIEGTPGTKSLLEWTRRVIDSQFDELIPLLEENDLLIAANTEFAAPSIAEYLGKPCVRTAYGPFIPGRRIPPPVFPYPKPNPVFRPVLLWKLLNIGLNLMVKKTLNKHRLELGMLPIHDQGEYAPINTDNFLIYSKYLGNVDYGWKYKWNIGGYCFNDTFPYDSEELVKLLTFIKKDARPAVWFSLGSCYADNRDRFADMLYAICAKLDYKLVVSCGWWNVGANLQNNSNLFRVEKPIPHKLIFPHCDAIIHHGGAGTTHSAARSGRPQMIVPLLLDQFYWAHRVKELGIGPGGINIKRITKGQLERKVVDVITNPYYREKADSIGILIRNEDGLENFCRHIESYQSQAARVRERA